MSKIWQQLVMIWGRLEIVQRATIVLVKAGAVVGLSFLTWAATQPDYRLLAADLPKGKVAEIAAFLESSHVAYRVTDVESVSATLRERGLRLLYDEPRRGTAGSRVNFVHPKDTGGILVELVEPARSEV